MSFVINSNIPNSKVSHVLVSNNNKEIIGNLYNIGIEAITVDNDYNLPDPIQSHADVNTLHINKNTILLNNSQSTLKLKLEELGFNVIMIEENMSNNYPFDSYLNAAIIDDKIICNYSNISALVKQSIEDLNLTIINTKQGYSKCSTLIISNNALITSDKSINVAAQNFSIDTLYVSNNSIELKGYSCGFIGGCGGMIDKDKLAISGSLDKFDDGKLIKQFCEKHGVSVVELCNGTLKDIGGILPILEF